MANLLHRLLASPTDLPFAVLRRYNTDRVEVFTGDVVDVDRLADIPLGFAAAPNDVLALVPFRQVVERGYTARDDGAPLRCLVITERQELTVAEALSLLPTGPIPLVGGEFEVADSDYGRIVSRVVDEEIGRGEGSNFVIRRDFAAAVDAPAVHAVLAWFRALLTGETGAYWTFAVHTPGISMVGATPERHVSVTADPSGSPRSRVMMNPICGTYRHPAGGPDPAGFREFLTDPKETDELFMVVDEELKMMSRICSSGGRVLGPYLKQMSRLTHTEYLLEGETELDVREVLRLTMFAPTVTGSPLQNACRVIARHEPSPRGYYGGVLALFTTTPDGRRELDAPILIRTAHLDDAGNVRIPVAATLVRHSTPDGEAAETRAKAAGVLTALGALAAEPKTEPISLADEPGIVDLLGRRNERLADFWLDRQRPDAASELAGRRVLIVDGEDEFTEMLAHQFRHFGMRVTVEPWDTVTDDPDCDLLVAGPGPGDPLTADEPRIKRLRDVIERRLESGFPLLAVCLSHQILAARLGSPIARLDRPRQGLQLTVDLFGTPALLGFYNTFTARLVGEAPRGVEVSADPITGDIYAMRGEGFVSVQGHLESVLSRDGLPVLESFVRHVLRTGSYPHRLPD